MKRRNLPTVRVALARIRRLPGGRQDMPCFTPAVRVTRLLVSATRSGSTQLIPWGSQLSTV